MGPTVPRDLRDHQFTLRIPTRIRKALEQEAERERRSIADLINLILEDRYAKLPRKA